MTSSQNSASQRALDQYSGMAQSYYDTALPALKARGDSASAALGLGESGMMASAFNAQRSNLTNTMADNATTATQMKAAQSKSALSGGNEAAAMTPADIGSQLANALWGSKFKEGNADIQNKLGLVSTIMGGSANAGNAAVNAAGMDVNAIRYLPNYNTTYANVAGAGAGAASIFGSLNQAYPQLFGPAGTTNTGAMLPTGWSSSSFPSSSGSTP